MFHATLGQGVSARHTIRVSCACVFDQSSTFSSHSSFVSPIFYSHPLDLSLHLLCGSVRFGQQRASHRFSKNSEVRMPRYPVTSTTTQVTQIMVQYGRCDRSSCTKSLRSSFGRTVTGKAIWENSFAARLGEGFHIVNACSLTDKSAFLIRFCGRFQNFLEGDQNLDPMWKVLNKEVDLGEPSFFLDHVYLGCTQRQCEVSKDTVDNYRTMFEWWISACGVEKLPSPQNLRISSWPYDMAGHAKKCVERFCELANKTTQQLYKVSTPCIDDHHFKEEEMTCVGEFRKYALKLFWNANTWHEFEDPIFYGQWTSLHDR